MSDSPEASPAVPSASSRMLREGGKLGLLTLLSRVLGLVREMTRAAFMGTGALADAFTVAFNLPNFLRRLFAENSMSAAFIPTFSGYLAEGDDAASHDKAREFLSATFTVLVFLVSIPVAVGIACAPLIDKLFG
ncbi:MAG: lipid II flippase MurJ, partial [Spirochaetota bacterium]